MVEWPVAVCVASAVLGLVAVLVALAAARRDARSQEARAGAAELALERNRAERAEALAAERLELLDEAKQLLADAAADGARVVAEHAELADALRRAPPGGRLDAVARVLSARAADRRARRAAEAGAPPAGDPAPGPRAPDPAGGDGTVA